MLLLLLIVALHLESMRTRYLLVQTGEDDSTSSRSNMRNKASALYQDCDLCCAPDGGTQGCTFICCEDVKTDDFPVFQPPTNGPRENNSAVLYFN